MMDFDDDVLDNLASIFGEDQIKEVVEGDLTRYQNDPVGFMENVLKIKNIPDKIVEMAESVRDNRVTIAQSCTGFGKTYFTAALSIWMYKCFKNSQVILTAAPPELNLQEKVWSELTDFIFKNKKIFKNDKILSLKVTDQINLMKDNDTEDENVSTRHVIIGRAIPSAGDVEFRKSRFSGFHQQVQLIAVDEGDAIGDEIYEAIEGCMSGYFARLLIIFNPKKKNGAVYNKIKTGQANVIILSAFDHVNVREKQDIIPGAVSYQQTIQRIHNWTEKLKDDEEPDANCFEVPEFLIGSIVNDDAGKPMPALDGGWRRIKQPQFSYIVLGMYPSASENTLISEVDIDRAVSRWKMYRAEYGKDSTNGLKCTIGMDVADEGGDANAICKKYGNYVEGFTTWRGIDVDKSSDKLAQIYCDVDGYQAMVEADGIGAAIPPKVGRMYYWRCENKECSSTNNTYLDTSIYQCPVCHKDLIRCHFNVKKIYVSAPSQKKCEFGKFHLLRDELAWAVAEWLKKEPYAMLPDDPELREELMCYEWWEDSSSGKIKVSDKKSVKKKIGRSDDKFASLRQAFYEPKKPSIRVI